MSLLNRFLNCFPAFQLDLWPTKLTENSIRWGLLPSIQMWWAHSLWHQKSLKETDPHIFNNSIARHGRHPTHGAMDMWKNVSCSSGHPANETCDCFFSKKQLPRDRTRVEDFMMIFFPFFDFFVGIHHSTDSGSFFWVYSCWFIINNPINSHPSARRQICLRIRNREVSNHTIQAEGQSHTLIRKGCLQLTPNRKHESFP